MAVCPQRELAEGAGAQGEVEGTRHHLGQETFAPWRTPKVVDREQHGSQAIGVRTHFLS